MPRKNNRANTRKHKRQTGECRQLNATLRQKIVMLENEIERLNEELMNCLL